MPSCSRQACLWGLPKGDAVLPPLLLGTGTIRAAPTSLELVLPLIISVLTCGRVQDYGLLLVEVVVVVVLG